MRSPYLSNPNILAHPDRIVETVALDLTAQETYLAGSPINAEGKLANDETAIGILLYDVHKSAGGKQGVVVVSGRINQEAAAAWCDITISDAAKSALVDITFTGDGARMGAVDLPFGETTVMGDTLEWDGNTEGLVSLIPVDSMPYYKVSDATPTLEDLSNGFHHMSCENGVPFGPGYSDGDVAKQLTENLIDGGGPFVVAFAPTEYMGITVPEAGTYLKNSNGLFTSSLTIPGYGKFERTEIEPLDPKFLPEGYPYEEMGKKLVLKTEGSGFRLNNPSERGYYASWDCGDIITGVEPEKLETQYWTVVFNGVTYENVKCEVGTGFVVGGAPLIIDGTGFATGTDYTTYPFCFYVEGAYIDCSTKDYHETVSLEFYQPATVIKPMAAKFMPNPSDLSLDWIAALKSALGM